MDKNIEYKKEIDLVLRGLFFEDWMDEEDYNELIQTAISEGLISYQKLSDDIKIGIKNGYSVEEQIKIVERVFKNKS